MKTKLFIGFIFSICLTTGTGSAQTVSSTRECMCNGAISPCTVCSPDLPPPLPKAPLILTSITPEQLTADYWINRLPNPDQPLKTSDELREMNEDSHAMIPELVDIFKMDLTLRGMAVRDQIELEYNTIKGRILLTVDNQSIPKSFFEEKINPLIQTEKIPSRITIKWGVATFPTSVRALPTDVRMLEEPGDIEFDQLQFTQIKLWTPVAIYHQTSDGKWVYIQAPYARGWVKAKDIALFPDRGELKRFAKSEAFLVVNGESIPIYSDPGLRTFEQNPSMGTILPLAPAETASQPLAIKTDKAYLIWVPDRGARGRVGLRKAYVDLKDDVSIGFLPYTQRNVIRQAFKLLGARYGWGGTYNGRDCSGFTQDVFLTVGVDMPRSSKGQTFVGTQIDHFEPFERGLDKVAAIRSGTPGVTLLKMPLHQMIFLGEERGHFYVIHSTWAERISMDSDEKRRINQVVVSDLSLNGNSYLGGLFDRIISVSELI